MTAPALVDLERHPISESAYAANCRRQLDSTGALVLDGFLTPATIDAILVENGGREGEAFFTHDTHNVYLTPPDPDLAPEHIFNRQIVSTKGCLADDQVPADSPLRSLYESRAVQQFLSGILGVDVLYPYDDELSSINVHFHRHGEELGWHFDNSSFAVTLLIQSPESGGRFEYVSNLRDSGADDLNFAGVETVLDTSAGVEVLDFGPGALVVFRGRDSMHRVTPSRGPRTRILVVFAYNTEPDIGLSEQAQETFYGRIG